MAFKIKEDDCTSCGACVSACSFDAIAEKGAVHWIDPDKCVDCSACESECPCSAIVAG